MERTRKILRSLLIIGLATAFINMGAFSTFTAQTSNPNNTFSTGTLVLSNTKQSGTACLSTGGGSTDSNVNNSCDILYTLTGSGSANLTVKNDGSLAAATFTLFALGGCTDSNTAGESYHGTGSPCSNVQLYIQRYSDAGFSTPSACLYGGASGATCNFSDATKTLGAFAAAYTAAGSGLSIGGLAGGESAYIKIAIQPPASAGNNLQGRTASTAFSWYASQ
jgi:hypothetical protein